MKESHQNPETVQALRAEALAEIRKAYPPILTTALVAELMHCTIGDVRDKAHNRELRAVRWGQQFRFFREEVLAALEDVSDEQEGISGD